MRLRVVQEPDGDPYVVDTMTGERVEGVEAVEITMEKGKPAVGVIRVKGIGLDVLAEIRHLID